MRTPRLLIAACLLTLTACGPTIPLNTGLKEASSDILFGHPPASPAPAPLPQVQYVPAPLEVPPVQQPSAPFPTFQPIQLPPAPPACPDASPFAVPPLEAAPTATAPPVNATYHFRYRGTITTDPGQPDQKVTAVPTTGTRQVVVTSPPSPVDGHYSYLVQEVFNGLQLDDSFTVYPAGHVVGPLQGSLPQKTPDAGIYFTGAVWRSLASNTSTQSFSPNPPIQVDVFDNFPGQTWQGGAGTDPTSQRTMTVNGNGADPNSSVVGNRVLVNACGDVVQAWEVKLTGDLSDVRGTGVDDKYTLVLDFATQYGGISVQDHLVLDYTDPATGKPQRYDVTATTDQTPRQP